MKKEILTLLCVLSIGILTVNCHAETTTYSDEYVTFNYDTEILGTIEKHVESGTLYYDSKSYTDIFSTHIRVINLDSYIKELSDRENPPTKENYKEYILKEEDSSYITKQFTDDGKNEVKSIERFSGKISYCKIISESDSAFIYVEFNGINDNDCQIGNYFRQIYDSVEVNDDFYNTDFSVEDIDGYSEFIVAKDDSFVEENETEDLSEYPTYEQLARNPDQYKESEVMFTGEVLQVMDGDDEIQLRLAVDGNYDEVAYCGYSPDIIDYRLLEGDSITIYGQSVGLWSYESTFGQEITIPGIWVTSITLN